jgi:2-polyprenyl-3-methyl-5-hydroxy-6-metoxy-1,4-benzoquinol methylase
MSSLRQRIYDELKYWTQSSWSLADVGRHFDEMAYEYDEINEGANSYFRRFTDTLRMVNLPDKAHFLDVTSRTGNGTAFFYQQGKVATAVCADFSCEMGKICRERLHSVGFHDFHWIHLQDYHWPFATGEFDVTLSLETVEHVPFPEQFVRELGRVTKSGGTLILSTPNVLWEPVHALAAVTQLHHSEGPHRFIRYGRLLNMVRDAGFHIEHVETTVLIPAGPEWLLRLGDWLESRTKESLMPWLGLRHILICRKE